MVICAFRPGHPVVRKSQFSQNLSYLTRFSGRDRRRQADLSQFLDVMTDPVGSPTIGGLGLNGQTKRLRRENGVQFTASGHGLITARVPAEIIELKNIGF
jgi:hypothetical protein